MGKSISLFTVDDAIETLPSPEIYNDKFDFYYQAHVKDGRLYQKEFRRDAAGNLTHEVDYPAEWIIGSGNATRSYLMNSGGFVTEMPLTWYVDSQRWDMSPSYREKNLRFSREIPGLCMSCHNGIPESTPFVRGHYTDVPLGITCERCHGPASEHVDKRLEGIEPGESDNDWIVNPASLPRDAQLSVCQQCHLSGTSVFQPGQDPHSFSPGMLITAHRAVFVNSESLENEERFGISSHAVRLAQSECFAKSDMTCTTCHDPHEAVQSLEPNYFNTICSSCHVGDVSLDAGLCTREHSLGPEQAMTGDCVSCHMRKSGTSDIPHVTFTDHWIRRTLPPPTDPAAIDRNPIRSDPLTLVEAVPTLNLTPGQSDRSKALAYFTWYQTKHELEAYLDSVVFYAQRASTSGAYDSPLAIAHGRAELIKNRTARARSIFENGLRADTSSVELAYQLGRAFRAEKNVEQAEIYFRKAVKMQPLYLDAQIALGQLLYEKSEYDSAQNIFEFVVATDPIHRPEAWNGLGLSQLVGGQVDASISSLSEAVKKDPDRPLAWVNLGSAYLVNADTESAEVAFLRAVDLDPLLPAPYGNLGLIYLQRDERSKARTMFEQLLSISPNDENAKRMLSELDDA